MVISIDESKLNRQLKESFSEMDGALEDIQLEVVQDWFYNGEAIANSLNKRKLGVYHSVYEYEHPRAAIIHEGGVTEYGNRATRIPFIDIIVEEMINLQQVFIDAYSRS